MKFSIVIVTLIEHRIYLMCQKVVPYYQIMVEKLDIFTASPLIPNAILLLLWQNKDVTEAVQKVAAAYDCKIVEGVLGHQMKQFVIDGNKVILSVSNPDTRVDDAEFEENEVYSIDIVTSTGEGKVIVLFKLT